MIINSKGGITKIWGETLLLLLLGIDIDILKMAFNRFIKIEI
jgi:hypothetical protein